MNRLGLRFGGVFFFGTTIHIYTDSRKAIFRGRKYYYTIGKRPTLCVSFIVQDFGRIPTPHWEKTKYEKYHHFKISLFSREHKQANNQI